MLRERLIEAAARRRIPVGNAFTKLLLHGDGTDGSSSIVDSSQYARTISPFGPTISTAQKKFGSGSISFSGTSQYATAPASTDWDFGSGDFTVEAFVYLTAALAGRYNLIVCHDNVGVSRGWLFLTDTDNAGKLNFTIFSNNATPFGVLSQSAFPQNAWKHVAACRAGNTLRLFIEGVQEASRDVTGVAIQNPNQPLVLGGLWNNGAISSATQHRWGGYMDEVRVKKGEALYTGSFTPPAAPFAS